MDAWSCTSANASGVHRGRCFSCATRRQNGRSRNPHPDDRRCLQPAVAGDRHPTELQRIGCRRDAGAGHPGPWHARNHPGGQRARVAVRDIHGPSPEGCRKPLMGLDIGVSFEATVPGLVGKVDEWDVQGGTEGPFSERGHRPSKHPRGLPDVLSTTRKGGPKFFWVNQMLLVLRALVCWFG